MSKNSHRKLVKCCFTIMAEKM